MKKCNCKTITNILFGVAFASTAIFSCSASEINFSNLTDSALDNIRGYLKETGQESLSINSDIKIPAAPELISFISWNVTRQDLLAKWGIDVQFKGHELTVKLGFIRGSFDSYTQTYKTEPVVTVLEIDIGTS